MKVAFLTDLHVCEKELGRQRPILERAVELIVEQQPDLVLVGGDLAGYSVPHRVTVGERNTLLGALVRLAEICPVVVIRGNHDSVGEWDFLSHCHNITYTDAVEHIRFPRFSVVALPWLDQGMLPDSDDYTKAVRKAYGDAIQGLAGEIRADARKDIPTFLLVHGAFSASMLHEGQPVVPTRDPLLDLTQLCAGLPFTAAFAGHYHLGQDVMGPIPGCYGGSLFVHNFGEDYPKTVAFFNTGSGLFETLEVRQPARVKLVIDVETRTVLEVKPPVLPLQGVPLAKLKTALAKSTIEAEFRLEYHTPEGKADVARGVADAVERDLRDHSGSVEVVARVERDLKLRDGADLVAAAPTLPAKIRAWAKGRATVSQSVMDGAILQLVEIERAVP